MPHADVTCSQWFDDVYRMTPGALGRVYMATVYKTVHSKTYLISPKATLFKWIHWGGTGGDYEPYRDIMPTWVSGGAPGDPNPVLIIEW